MPPASTPTAAPEPPIAPQMPSALLRSGAFLEAGRDDRERRRCDDRRAEALHGARRDQHALRPGETAEERGDREDRDADVEDAAPPEQVGRAAAEQEEPAERDRVRGDHPLEALLREVQRLADRRERDVDDRHVEHGHEERGADDRQRLPAVRVELGHRRSSYGENGRGVAETFGMETRATVENSWGRQAWQILASQATERKMKASSIEKPHWSTRKPRAFLDRPVERLHEVRPRRPVDDPAVGELRHRPGSLLALEQVDADRHLARDLDAGEADLAVAHRRVHVADREHPARLAHRQVDRRAGAVQVIVEVAAVAAGEPVRRASRRRSPRRSRPPSGAAGRRCARSCARCRPRRGTPASAVPCTWSISCPMPGISVANPRSAGRTSSSSTIERVAGLGAADRDRPGRGVDALEVDLGDEVGLALDLPA